jgi:hypothetical protein
MPPQYRHRAGNLQRKKFETDMVLAALLSAALIQLMLVLIKEYATQVIQN